MNQIVPSNRNSLATIGWEWLWRTGVLIPILLLTVLFLRAPQLDPHDWDYDEGINLAKALLVGRDYHMFTEIWSDQPPLFTMTLATIFHFTGPSVAAGRVVVMLSSALLVWSLFMAVRSSLSTVAAITAVFLLVFSEFYLRLSGALMIGLPSLALGTFALMLLVVRRQTWPWLLAAAITMALTLQIKLMAAVILVACAVAILLPPRPLTPALGIWRRFLTAVIWLLTVAAAYLALAFFLGALHFDLLFGTHFGNLTRSVQDFNLAGNLYLPRFAEQHMAYLLIAAAGLVYAGIRGQASVLIPLSWLLAGVAAFAVQRPLWYHHTLVLGLPLTWLSAYGVEGWWSALKGAWSRRSNLAGLAASGLLVAAACAVLAVFYFYPTPLVERQAWQMDVYRPPYVDAVANQLAADAQDKQDFVFTDHPFYAFQAGLAVPPPIAVLSRKSLESGIITQQILLDVLRTYKPKFVLLERFTDTYSPEVMDEISRNYAPKIEIGPTRYYVRNP